MEVLQGRLSERKEFNQQMRDLFYKDDILEEFDEIDCDRAVVWIDPLDGTKEFVNGNLPAVTVLIGVAIDGVPKIGVVHHPYMSNENNGKGITMFGTQEHGAFSLEYDSSMTKEQLISRVPQYMQPFDQNLEVTDQDEIRVAVTLSRFSPQVQELLDSLAPVQPIRAGGAGNKVNRVALGEADAYV